ncbi:MAG TPA: polysaccharide biosynthesis tyrosine autokinase [Terriglobia bacterium]|nr:polysaccharide biosynthesis tyrosine autokinase [Terriglobia bacterium]
MNLDHNLDSRSRPTSLAKYDAELASVVDGERFDSTRSDLRRNLEIPLRYRWTILTTAFVAVTLATVYAFKIKPVYRATAQIEIDNETPQIESLQDTYRGLPNSDDTFLKTQVRVLESDSLALETIAQLDLADNPEFFPQPASARPGERASRLERGKLLNEFQSRLGVTLVPESRIIETSFESTSPDLAARAVNALVNNYVEHSFHEKYDATRQASGWMEQQLDELKAKVERSQKALVDYERRNAIVNIDDKQNVAEAKLADLDRDLTVAESDLAQKESLYNLMKSDEKQVAFVAQNYLLQKLEEKDADLKAQYVDALGQYGPNFPKVVRLRDEVNEMQSLIDAERQRTVAQIQNEYEAAAGREKLLATAEAQQKNEIGKLNELLIQQNLLKREAESNQQLYDSLLQRLKDATVSAGLRATNVHIVDSALAPALPVRPRKVRSILLGLASGLLLGISLAFVQESLDSSVKTAEDAERLIGVPSLASIPAMHVKRSVDLLRWRNGSSTNGSAALSVLQNPISHQAESYRALRTAILFSTAPRPPQVLLVTSAQPGEGKTCTSVNLGAVLAQRGGRVLIVDSDLRKPGVSEALHLAPKSEGLTGVLTGVCDLDTATQPTEPGSNVWILPTGPIPPNPAELLSSETMAKVLQQARDTFDYVILDSPPALLFTDATLLSTLADGVVLVVQWGVTGRGALLRSHRTLRTAGGRILGLVMNKVDARQDKYGHYDSYYYLPENGNGNGNRKNPSSNGHG